MRQGDSRETDVSDKPSILNEYRSQTVWVMGLDGCKAGWVGVLLDINGVAEPRSAIYPTFEKALKSPERAQIIAVDMPIGFADGADPEGGGRACEREARGLLGQRKASVFSSPFRASFNARTYEEALAFNRTAGGTGLSKQSWNIMGKMREIDDLMSPLREGCVHEVHPELSFSQLSGAPMQHPKRQWEGRNERLKVLTDNGLPRDLFDPHPYKIKDVAKDDLLDAAVCARSAIRIARGEALCLPADPPRDAKGLRMAIWA